MPSSGRNYLSHVLAELRRAMAAAHRYEDLRYRSAGRGNIAPAEMPQRILEEFYASAETAESRRPAWRSAMLGAMAGAMAGIRRIVLRIASREPRKA